MSEDIFDTCILISRKEKAYPKISAMSAVVLQELTIGASDNQETRVFELMRKSYETRGLLVVPNGEDW